jgi:ABC-type uncharacterized transport system involved in gliding motility auxiliary subunit
MKLSIPSSKYLRYLFLSGPVLLIMGLSAGAVAGAWLGVPLGLMIVGALIIGAWLLYESTQPGFWGRRSTQVGTNAMASTIAVLVILGLVNFLGVRYSTRLDLTENRIFTLAPQSQAVAQGLKQPVKALVFDSNPNPVDRELLENYRRQSGQFTYEYIDPQAQPGIASRLEVKSIGEVHLESGEKHRFVQTINPEQRLSERQLTNGLVQLTSNQQQKVFFLQGHGERVLDQPGENSIAQAFAQLKEESFAAEPLNLAAKPTIPEDVSVVVVAGPQRPLIANEIKALQDYLKRKSGLLLMIDPQTDPQLNSLLEAWGVQVSDRIVVDPAGQASGLGPGVTIVNQYGDHPITQSFQNGISFYPLARPIATAPVDGVRAVPLLFTSDRTQAQKLDPASGELTFDPASDPKPPYAIGVALTRSVSTANPPADGTTPPQARLVVIGNSSFAADGLFEQQLNGDLFLNAVSWLSQRDDQTLTIRPRELTNRRIVLTPEQQTTVLLLSVVFLPVIAWGTAGFVWWRRR